MRTDAKFKTWSFDVQDIEKIAPKKGVIQQSVKEVIQVFLPFSCLPVVHAFLLALQLQRMI